MWIRSFVNPSFFICLFSFLLGAQARAIANQHLFQGSVERRKQSELVRTRPSL